MEDRNRLIDFARLSLFKSNNDKTYSSKLKETNAISFPRHTQAKGMGSMEFTKLKGNTLVWNQLSDKRDFSNSVADTRTYFAFQIQIYNSGSYVGTLLSADVNLGKYVNIFDCNLNGNNILVKHNGQTIDIHIFEVNHPTNNRKFLITFDAIGLNPTSVGGINLKNIQLIDLTQMFGAGNEPSTYEEYLRLAPKVADPYAYDEGTIVSFKDAAIKTTGRNLWDEEWKVGAIVGGVYSAEYDTLICTKNHIKVEANRQYYIKSAGFYMDFYDSDKVYLSEVYSASPKVVIMPSNVSYVTFTFYNSPNYSTHDICINVSDPSFNGQYEPYISHTLPIDTDFEVEGEKFFPLGLNGINGVHDELTQTKAVKRFGMVNLEDLEYVWNQGSWFYPWETFGGQVSANTITENGYTTSYNRTYLIIDAQVQPTGKLLFELANPIEMAVESGLSLPYQQGGMETLEGISAIPSGDVTYYHDVQYNHWSLAAKTFVGNLIADTIKAAGKLLKIESEVQVKALRIGKARISWDESAEAIKVDGSMYTTGFSSAGGVNPSGASGNVSVLAKMLTFSQSDFDEAWGMYHKTITNDLHNPLLITQCTRTDGEVVITDIRVTSETIDIMVDLEGEYKFIAMGTQS